MIKKLEKTEEIKHHNQLILGDNFEELKNIPDESVDLIYIDPPFFSNRNYEIIWGDKGEVRSFEDRWAGGMEHYIGWLCERVEVMYKKLKKTGSFYLHCDWHADAYIKIYILDKLFGKENFRNEIIWKRTNTTKFQAKEFGKQIDKIYFYSKSNKFKLNKIYCTHNAKSIKLYSYDEKDDKGPYQTVAIVAGGTQRYKGRKEFEFKNIKAPWLYSIEKLEAFDKQGLIYQANQNSIPRLKKYLNESEGLLVSDLWVDDDVKPFQGISKEAIGYPTQKPEALLERIIKASSKEGDTVMDCFCGGGTTITVADRLDRKWIGIDQSVQAITVTEGRLNKQQNLFSTPFEKKLHKYDYDTLRNKEAFEFEKWIIQQFGGSYNEKQRSDVGIDGSKNNIPIQVKRSDDIGRNVIDNFKSAIARFYDTKYKEVLKNNKIHGYIIAFTFGKGAREEIARLKRSENVNIELILVEDIVEIAYRKDFKITFNYLGLQDRKKEIHFQATLNNMKEIEIFQWDFNYDKKEGFKPSELFDKTGNAIYLFEPGEHNVACRITDKEGIQTIETIKIKVNGGVNELF